MKNFILSILIVLSGFFYYTDFQTNEQNTRTENNTKLKVNYNASKTIDSDLNFFDIFINNLIVGLILSVFGFLSGGLITIVVLFWNGYILSIIYGFATQLLNYQEILYYSKHIPLEFLAFILLSSIGFKGFLFYKKTYTQKKPDLERIPKLKEFILPITLLFIASIIETL